VNAIYAGQSFRSVLCDLNLTPNQVWSMARVDREWSAGLEAVLMTTRRDDPKHGTNAACVAGCVRRLPQSSKGQDGEAAHLVRLAEHRPQHQQPGPRDCEQTARR
jgi:hypothetical protein